MIKVTVQYNDRLRSIYFPCSEKELTSALTEIHAISDTSELFVTEVEYPEELGFLKDRFVNPDELNYLAKRFDMLQWFWKILLTMKTSADISQKSMTENLLMVLFLHERRAFF